MMRTVMHESRARSCLSLRGSRKREGRVFFKEGWLVPTNRVPSESYGSELFAGHPELVQLS
jgi:hypothetical protein